MEFSRFRSSQGKDYYEIVTKFRLPRDNPSPSKLACWLQTEDRSGKVTEELAFVVRTGGGTPSSASRLAGTISATASDTGRQCAFRLFTFGWGEYSGARIIARSS
jgi:hypothetical protein